MDEEKKKSDEIKNIMSEDEDENNVNPVDYASDSTTNSDDAEKCPICLLSFDNQEIGKPIVCSHSFCFLCIFEWSKVVKTCPIDRKEFDKIVVFENLDSTKPLRTVTISEQISLNEFTNGENEYTQCEICRRTDREDVMLLCDGCDKGFHMDCLDPPLLEIPEDNWYCVNCDGSDQESESEEETEEEADVEEIYDLQNEIEQEIGSLPSTRLRTRQQQPQIIRTLQSERIRNAILARRSTMRRIEPVNDIFPSTSQGITRSSSQTKTARKPVTRRKTTKRRRRRATKVVEYEIKDGQKFPIKRTRVVRRRKRKTRKSRKGRKTTSRRATSSKSSSSCFKNSNANVYELQKGRQLAGLSNFNIFEPTNLLDYVPDDDFTEEIDPSPNNAGSTLIQSVVNYTNPFRRQALIKKRVIQNFTTTSSDFNIIDSILNETTPFNASSSTFTKISKETAKEKVKKSANDAHQSGNSTGQGSMPKDQENPNKCTNTCTEVNSNITNNPTTSNDRNENQQNLNFENIESIALSEKKSPQKKKKATFDMFGDSPVNQEEEPPNADICPNFSIYGSAHHSSDENLSQSHDQANILNEENVDLVQMSDGEHVLDEIEPAVIRSQPASPDLEVDANDQIIEQHAEERSYTPPILAVSKDKSFEESEKRKKEREHKKHKRRELERYNVRERLKEKSPKRARDRYGRNRTRTRSRSNERYARRRSRSHSRGRHRSRQKKSRTRTPEKRRRKSFSRSPSSNERRYKQHKSKHKKTVRRTRSRSLTPQPSRYRDDKSPRRRDRSTSDKSKKKKNRNRSKEITSAHTKEVFTSGQNILVSVNFNNQEDERTRSKSLNKEDPIVDITAKKKINVNSRPVAIIDLARSPFKELTPEYKKESNVIELSDSEGEKHLAPKSPDSTKLYDPFDILNSPSNENVSSSQTTLKSLNKNNVDFTNKLGPAIIKNLNLPLINEENLVSSSSSVNIFDKVFGTAASNSKVDVIQNEAIVIPAIGNATDVIESPYSPGNDFDDSQNDHEMEVVDETTKTSEKQVANIFDDLFGSSTPPFLEKAKSSKKSSSDPDKYLNKLKRQERVIEEVKLVIKPYYSKRIINKEQYKEIMRKAVPKICHNKSGEINPSKIKHLIDSYVKFYTHKKKRSEPDEVF